MSEQADAIELVLDRLSAAEHEVAVWRAFDCGEIGAYGTYEGQWYGTNNTEPSVDEEAYPTRFAALEAAYNQLQGENQ